MTPTPSVIENSISKILSIIMNCDGITPSEIWQDLTPSEIISKSNNFAVIKTHNENNIFIYLETRKDQIARMKRLSKLDITPSFFPEIFFCEMVNDVCVCIIDGGDFIESTEKEEVQKWNNMVKEFDYEKIYSFIFAVFGEDVFDTQFRAFLRRSFNDGIMVSFVNPNLCFYKSGTGYFTIAPIMTRFSDPEKLRKLLEEASKENKEAEEEDIDLEE
jgi:23S rRNA maturation mini-RNase III